EKPPLFEYDLELVIERIIVDRHHDGAVQNRPRLAVQAHALDAAALPFRIRHMDLEHGRPILRTIRDPVFGPIRRDAGTDLDGAALPHAESQNGFESHAQHPAGRAGIPRPTAAAYMRRLPT